MHLYQELAAIEARGGSAALCTVTYSQGSTPRQAGSKMLVYPDGTVSGTIGGGEMESRVITAALEVIAKGRPERLEYSLSDPKKGDPGVCGGQMEVFVEPVISKATIVVVGAGHVGRAVVHLAAWLGYRVVVSDDREEFVAPDKAPGADEYVAGNLEELPQNMKINAQTYLVLTTRNSGIDVSGLPALLDTPAAFIGVIGSKRRWQITREKLIEQGISKKKLDKVISPMGIEINAESPEEIALSILSEIVMLQRGGDGKRMNS